MVADRADHLVVPVLEVHARGARLAAGEGRRAADLLALPAQLEVVSQRAVVAEPDRERSGAADDDRAGVERVLGRHDANRRRSPGPWRSSSGSSSPPQPARASARSARVSAGAGQGERILCPAVTRPIAIACALAAAVLAGCGGEIEVPESDQTARQGAELFYERCSGCHTFEAANAYGSKAVRPAPGRRAHQRPELRRSEGRQRRRAVRDPQRWLLRGDHARQHRDR